MNPHAMPQMKTNAPEHRQRPVRVGTGARSRGDSMSFKWTKRARL
jgi:hypothetical protein